MQGLIDRISSRSDVFFKHLSNKDEDLTKAEREDIVRDLAVNNVPVFLTRYGKCLLAADCALFDAVQDDVVKCVLEHIRKKKVDKKSFRNRRYAAMQKMLTSGNFFSDEKMREREPYLFDAMIGRFLDYEQHQELRPTLAREDGEGAWSGVLNQFSDSSEIAERRRVQQAEWDDSAGRSGSEIGIPTHNHRSRFMAHVSNMIDTRDFRPEEDEDDDDEGEDKELAQLRREMERLSQLDAETYNELGEDETAEVLRREFESYMKERFLAGKDLHFFDYTIVDEDDSLDDLDPIRARDEEERWFDED